MQGWSYARSQSQRSAQGLRRRQYRRSALGISEDPDVAIPLVKDGLIYNLHNDGKLQCIELETGKEVYLERTHSAQHRSSPFYADGHIYLCNHDGICTVVKAGRKFELVSSNDLGERITASPIVSNGVLYLRTFKGLYAIKAK